VKTRLIAVFTTAAMIAAAISLFIAVSRHQKLVETERTAQAYQMGFEAGLKSHQPPWMNAIPMPPESASWSTTDLNAYSTGFAEGVAEKAKK
jgi:hypothetical protein